MTWTYSPTTSAFNSRDYVRREIGDVVTTDQLLSDEEIAQAISVEGDLVLSSARCCEWLATYFARKADIVEGKLSLRLSQRSAAYKAQAERLRMYGGSFAVPYAGGISVTDKDNVNNDSDRVPPAFWKGMSDNPNEQAFVPGDTDTNPATE